MNARTRSEPVFEYRRTRLFNRDTSCLDTNKQAPTNPSGHHHDDYPHHALNPKTSQAASLGSSVMRPRLPVTSLFRRPSRSEQILSKTRLSHSHYASPLRCVPAGVCARVGPPRIDFLRLPFCDLGVGGHLEFTHSASSARAPISGPPLPSYCATSRRQKAYSASINPGLQRTKGGHHSA